MKLRVGVLTSSRADYGIYLPLLKLIGEDPFFDLSIIAFGTHLSKFHGYTINDIYNDGFEVPYKVETLLVSDSQEANSMSVGLTFINFASFWKLNSDRFDIVFCLGDRFEMFAAVFSGLPFDIKFAHIHGGETTLGALDNVYRHSISLASKIHFAATSIFKERIIQIINSDVNVYDIGALGLSNFDSINLMTRSELLEKWKVDIEKPLILFTYHPETQSIDNLQYNFQIIIDSLKLLLNEYQILITLPNADISGIAIREMIYKELNGHKNIFIYENLGSKNYLSLMAKCSFVFGNSSSGIIEAASLNKYVINIGIRQEGRARSKNTLDIDYSMEMILNAVAVIKNKNYYFDGENIYYKPNTSQEIIKILKNKFSV